MDIGRDLPLLTVDSQNPPTFLRQPLPEGDAKPVFKFEYCKKTLNFQILMFYSPPLGGSVWTW
jgi:hypothetical protein